MTANYKLLSQLIILCPDKKQEIKDVLCQYDIEVKCTDEGKDVKSKIDFYIHAKSIEGLRQSTLSRYRSELEMFANKVKKKVEDIKTQDIRIYLSNYTGLKNSTLSTKVSTLKSFFGWLAGEDIITKNPAYNIKRPKKQGRLPKALTPEELEIIRESCKTLRQRALVEVIYSTGCRLSELVNMNISDIDLVNHSTRIIGKGNKERVVFFTWKALRYLDKYLKTRKDDGQALFVSSKKPYNRLGNRSIQKEVENIALKAGLDKNVHPHIFRHTLATHLLENGADLVSVQNILGHENPATTQIYASLTEQHKKQTFHRCMSK